MKVSDWLKTAKTKVAPLDAELILLHVLNQTDRSFLVSHDDLDFNPETADQLLEKRAAGTPLSYLTGKREFYGRDFHVTPNVLIPRTETEDIISIALDILKTEPAADILDIGTGSGCIPITLALESDAKVSACDISEEALRVAEENNRTLEANVNFFKSDLLENVSTLPTIITANLPYVNPDWDWLGQEIKHEPALALYADDNGLALIKKLINQIVTKKSDNKTRYLILEADISQHDDIIAYTKAHEFNLIKQQNYILAFTY